jgi:hypothetical protein
MAGLPFGDESHYPSVPVFSLSWQESQSHQTVRKLYGIRVFFPPIITLSLSPRSPWLLLARPSKSLVSSPSHIDSAIFLHLDSNLGKLLDLCALIRIRVTGGLTPSVCKSIPSCTLDFQLWVRFRPPQGLLCLEKTQNEYFIQALPVRSLVD